MAWLKRILIVIGLLLAIAMAVPYFISLNDYIPRIEKAISTELKEQVSIKSIKFTTLPRPNITVNGITIGTNEDIILKKVVLIPDIFSLLQSSIVIKSIEVDSPILTQKSFDKISKLSKTNRDPEARHPSQVRIENISFVNALIKFGKVSFGPFDVRVNLDSTGKPFEASISTLDGALNILIKPDESHYLIEASAKKWALPIESQLIIDELNIKGIATTKEIKFSQLSAKLYGGSASGDVTLSWLKGYKLNGNLNVKQVEMQKIASMLSSKTHISGKLNAEPAFSASSDSADQLMNTLHLETTFNVQNGVLYGIDIQKAATSLIKKGSTGGETRFDQLSGHLVIAQRSYSFTQLKITSGTLAVDGNVNISAKKDLSGRVNAQVTAVGISTKVPLNISGTIESPLLYPTGATIAGAAIGTAIMGPGVGTSVGAKVGGWVDNIFGKKENKSPN
jgi:uncharacterized protein involved in outer membrane biogenesis